MTGKELQIYKYRTVDRLDSMMRLYFPYQYDNFCYGTHESNGNKVGTVRNGIEGPVIAIYDWEKNDTPYFFFSETLKTLKEINYLQKIYLPFASADGNNCEDSTRICHKRIALLETLRFVVQELRKKLLYTDILYLKFYQKENMVIREDLMTKIKYELRKVLNQNLPAKVFSGWTDDLEAHLAFCCIEER